MMVDTLKCVILSCMLVAGCGAQETTVSTSPDKRIRIVEKRADETNDLELFVRDVRNNGFEYCIASSPAPLKVEVQWHGSDKVTIITGDERSWFKQFYVLRFEKETGRHMFREPVLPDLQQLLLKHTKEDRRVFTEVDSFKGFAPAFRADTPSFVRRSLSEDGKPLPENPLPENQFIIRYGTFADSNDLEYTFIFSTKDWVGYELLRISRLGEGSEFAVEAQQDPVKELVLYQKPGFKW